MQALFGPPRNWGQNTARSQLMSSRHRLSGSGLLGSAKPESKRLAAARSAGVNLRCEILLGAIAEPAIKLHQCIRSIL